MLLIEERIVEQHRTKLFQKRNRFPGKKQELQEKLKVFQIKTFIDIGNKANIINADYESILSSGQKRQEQNNNAENNLIRDGLINKLNLPMQTTEQ